MQRKKRIVVVVISDLVTDQRVHKVSMTLTEAGYEVLLVGARRKYSLPLASRAYPTWRLSMIFQKKFWFYAEFNVRAFFKLLFVRADIFLGNDLDVMPATFCAGRLRRRPVVYDTHEYYLAMAGLDGKPRTRAFWQKVEAYIFPRLDKIYTICQSFCQLYEQDYGRQLSAVRNVPYLQKPALEADPAFERWVDSLVPGGKRLLLYQGVGMNPHRGLEELVQAMGYLDPSLYHLWLVGGGDLLQVLKDRIDAAGLWDRIRLVPRVPFERLPILTKKADLGLSLDKAENLNHRYGLPNKIFDYLHAGVPVLASRLVEVERIVERYQVGLFIDSHEPAHIAQRIRDAFEDPERYKNWKMNTLHAKLELNWEKEGKIVEEIFKQVESHSG